MQLLTAPASQTTRSDSDPVVDRIIRELRTLQVTRQRASCPALVAVVLVLVKFAAVKTMLLPMGDLVTYIAACASLAGGLDGRESRLRERATGKEKTNTTRSKDVSTSCRGPRLAHRVYDHFTKTLPPFHFLPHYYRSARLSEPTALRRANRRAGRLDGERANVRTDGRLST